MTAKATKMENMQAKKKAMTNKKIPMRQCVGCGEMKEKRELIRVLKIAENEIVLDET